MIDKAAQVDLDQRVVSQKGLTKGSAIFQNKLLTYCSALQNMHNPYPRHMLVYVIGAVEDLLTADAISQPVGLAEPC